MGAKISDFDLAALYAALDSERESRSLSWSGLTREVNAIFKDVRCPPIATSTITTLNGKPDVIGNAALQLLVWLNRAPESFVPGYDGRVGSAHALPRVGSDRILRFDTPAIYRALDAARIARQLSWKQVAEQIGMATATQLTRFRKGGGVGMCAVTRIAQWLGRPVASFTVASAA
jgi:hypothetical protein